MAVQGTWFGLPDYGVTEKIGKFFGYQGSTQPTTFYNNLAAQTGQMGPAVYAPTTSTTGQIKGVTSPTPTYNAPTPINTTNTGDTGGSTGPTEQQLYEQQLRNDINNKYAGYFDQLNSMLNTDLPEQRATNEALVQNQYNTGLNSLTSQKAGQITELEGTQKKSLKDISSNVRNLFNAGNQFLGARGAGDSSATGQMSYAIAKIGAKQRGDVMSQIGSRRNQINDIFNSEVNKLDSEKNSNLLNVANWYSQSTAQLKQMMAQGELNKGQDLQNLTQTLYNQALTALNQVNQDMVNKRNALMSWAATNSKSIDQVLSTLQSIGAFQPNQMNSSLPVQVSDGTAYTLGAPSGLGASTSNRKIVGYDIFGQPKYE